MCANYTAQSFKDFYDGFVLEESYSSVRKYFLSKGYSNEHISKILNLHKDIKDLHRLEKEDEFIDSLVFLKNGSVRTLEELEHYLEKYGKYPTATKTNIKEQLKNYIIYEDETYIGYKIVSAEEAYLFKGLTKWCTNREDKNKAAAAYNNYTQNGVYPMFVCMNKQKHNNIFDIFAILFIPNNILVWGNNDTLFVLNSQGKKLSNNLKFKLFDELPGYVIEIINYIKNRICKK